MTQAAAKTGLGPTIPVAIEQHYPEHTRIISDHLASSMLPLGVSAFVWMMRITPLRNWFVKAIEKKLPGLCAGLLCRKRYIDEKLGALDPEFEALINMGTGFDTCVYRMGSSRNIPTWEIDFAQNIIQKKNRLTKVLGHIPDHIQLIATDFERDELSPVLSTHGYSADLRTFFIWEAVSQFLTPKGMRTTLGFLSKAPAGSRLVFTYIRKDFLSGDNMYGQEKTYRLAVEKGYWTFGLHPDEVSDFLVPYGWKIVEHLGYDELAETYLEPTGRKLSVLPIERLVLAGKYNDI